MTPLLRMRGIVKRYPGVTALEGVDFDVAAGEVVGLIGENGAGKSTLLKVLAGATPPDEGTLEWQGRPLRLRDPREAQLAGISVIYQELSLAPNLTVQENLYLGREPRSHGPFIAGMREREMARAALAQVGLDVAPDTPTAQLSVAQRQLVEIAKALALDARLVVMDEPTSALAPREARRLFELIGRLAQRGIGVVYVSHRLEEVLSVCHRVVALRDGRRVGETGAADATQDDLIRLMIGGDLSSLFPKESIEAGEPVLTVRELSVPGLAEPVSFEVRAGEILGWFGLIGSGRTEAVEAVFGARRARGGAVTVHGGAPGPYADPRGAIRAGLGLVPEDRKERGLILGLAVEANVTLPGLARHARLGWRDRAWEREAAERGVRELAIRTPSIEQAVRNLSGGNQQKVVLAKWLELAPRVLLLDEPTRGIDVGAKAEIFSLMGRMARRGMGLVFVSSEIEEIVGMADRVLVFHHGRIAGEVLREALDAERLLRLATGLEAA